MAWTPAREESNWGLQAPQVLFEHGPRGLGLNDGKPCTPLG